MHRSTFNRAVTGDSGKWLLPNGLSLVLTEPPWESWRLPELESGGGRLF
jgi:hypothetical protein